MKIYTSYFANYRNFPKDYKIFSIVRLKPRWSKHINLQELAPSASLIGDYKKGVIDEKEYERRFRKEIKGRNIKKMLASLGYDKVVLVCYEKSEDFCHRHILRDVMKEQGLISAEL